MDSLLLLRHQLNMFEGTVADNYDPQNWGRVRVHIKGKTEGITDVTKLPYARVLHPLKDALNVSDTPPEIGTVILMVMLNHNDYNSLIILGCFKKLNQTQ